MVSTVGMRRRHMLRMGLAGCGAALPLAWPGRAWAAWPERPVRLVVPSAAGGSPDTVCRILTDELARTLQRAFVVDNKAGAGGNVGMTELATAAPDGYTFGYGNVGTLAINRTLFPRLPYDPDRLVPVALLGHVQSALVVRPDLPVKSVKELIALAKAQPGRLSMGSAGNGTTGHLGGELFKSMTGTFITHIPYRGSPQAIQDLLAGQVDLLFDNLSSIGTHVKSGRVKALAVTGRIRAAAFPDLPTVAETVPGFETTAWGGIVAPPGTPREIVTMLNAAINRALAAPAVLSRYAAISWEPSLGPPERLRERATRETRLWADVIRRSGAKVE